MPPWARKSPKIAEVLPLLYLHGLSTGDFVPALEQFLGSAAGLSPATVTRLTVQWQADHAAFGERDLSKLDYVYVWADGVHLGIRLGEGKACVLVLIGVRADGTKELIAMDEGYRESGESWANLLRDCARRRMRAPVLAMTFKLIESARARWRVSTLPTWLRSCAPEPGSNAAFWSSAMTQQPEGPRMISLYGTNTHEPAELGQLIAELLGVRFTERESDYRGIYLAARLGQARIEIQPNAIPGDDDQPGLYSDAHPDTPVLVLVSGADQDGALGAGLAAIDGLAALKIRPT